jgi:hypothetical protein
LTAVAGEGDLPERKILPLFGFNKPTIRRIKVVLPAPFEPNNPKLMPLGISNETSLITLRWP